jgi:DNA-binding XRE family transcriptional regulator
MESLAEVLLRLARVIRNRRAEAGYNQAEIAHAADVYRTWMGQIERGEANPSVKTLYKIARVLGLTLAELFVLAAGTEGEAEPQPRPVRSRKPK